MFNISNTITPEQTTNQQYLPLILCHKIGANNMHALFLLHLALIIVYIIAIILEHCSECANYAHKKQQGGTGQGGGTGLIIC